MRYHTQLFWILLLAGAVLISIISWAPAVGVGFLSDDYEWFPAVSQLSPTQVWKLFWLKTLPTLQTRYRPLTGLLFWLDWQLWHTQAAGYHLTNIILHLLTSGALFLCTFYLSTFFNTKRPLIVSSLAALFFLLNPLAADAVTWIDGRYDVLAALLFFIALFCYLKFRRNLSYRWLGLSLIFHFGSLLAKEMGLVFPVLLLLLPVQKFEQHDPSSMMWKKQLPVWLFWGNVIAYIFLSWLGLGHPIWQAKGYTGIFTIAHTAIIWTIVTGIFLLSWYVKRNAGKQLFLRAWIWIGISLLPIAFYPTEIRFLYIPLGLSCIWVVFMLNHYFHKLSYLLTVSMLIILTSAYFLTTRNQQWRYAGHIMESFLDQIGQYATKNRMIYLFNLPDSHQSIPIFRTYVSAAIYMRYPQTTAHIIVGPTTIDISTSKAQKIDDNTIITSAASGYVIFAPFVTKQTTRETWVNWQHQWQARFTDGNLIAQLEINNQNNTSPTEFLEYQQPTMVLKPF